MAPPPRTTAPPTITDIARRVGLSHTAVSLALRGAPGVSAARRDEILAVAQAVHYQPQLGARLLRGQGAGQLGLVLQRASDVVSSSGFSLPVMQQFVQVCEEERLGYHLEFYDGDSSDGFRPPRQLAGGLVGGVLLAGYVSGPLRAWLEEQHRPWVSLEEPGPLSVMSAAGDGAYLAVQHLAALGHRHIAFAGGPMKYSTHRLSRTGFQRALSEFNLPAPRAWQCELDLEAPPAPHAVARAWATALLTSGELPTAVLATDHRVAKVLMHEALKRGLRVPEDLSVISFGTVTDARQGSPILTTIEIDFHQVVLTAVRHLRRRLAGQRVRGGTTWVPPHLIAGETVAPPPR